MHPDFRFVLPRKELDRAYLQILPAIVLAFIVAGWILPDMSWRRGLLYVFGTAIIVGICYAYTRSYTWVQLSENGIRAANQWGFKRTVPWSADLNLRRADIHNGIRTIALKSQDTGSELFIPVAIVELPAFDEAISKFAPISHPLRNANVR